MAGRLDTGAGASRLAWEGDLPDFYVAWDSTLAGFSEAVDLGAVEVWLGFDSGMDLPFFAEAEGAALESGLPASPWTWRRRRLPWTCRKEF